jgi:D-glycero-beta-D-manno-heptose-7-phosphate kinase
MSLSAFLPPLPDFSAGRVAVVGDVMLDRYWQGSTSRISPEAPVPVVRVEEDSFRPGGAANVAVNIRSLGASVHLFGLVGHDEAAHKLIWTLEQQSIEPHFVTVSSHPTITKLRVLSRHQQLIRLDFETDFEPTQAQALVPTLSAFLGQCQALVLSDYRKGTLADPQALILPARAQGLPVVVDPKGVHFDLYRGASLLTPNLGEFEAVVGHCATEAQLLERAEHLRAHLALEALLITRSERGMTLVQAGMPALHLPAQAREVFDVTGAGDTVVALIAAGLACGCSLAHATALGNLAAGLVVARLGTASVSLTELQDALQRAAL